ncbi:MAG: GtrA family protein [Chloroflexi bacterium]|nr:GtrA family protein [Chloroflexota bacterium]
MKSAFGSIYSFAHARPMEVKRFIKFSIVGLIGFTIDTTTLNLLVGLAIMHTTVLWLAGLLGIANMHTIVLRLAAKTISFSLALTSNFIWNRYWIYPETRTERKRVIAPKFALVNAGGWALNLVIFGFLSGIFISIFSAWLEPQAAQLLGINAAQVCAVAVVMFWNFFVNRYWTFRKVV